MRSTVLYCIVDKWTAIHNTFPMNLKQSKLEKALYISIQHEKLLFIYWISRNVSCGKSVHQEFYTPWYKIQRIGAYQRQANCRTSPSGGSWLRETETFEGKQWDVGSWLREAETFQGKQWDVGLPHSVHNVWMEEQILKFEWRPTIAAPIGTSPASLQSTLRYSICIPITCSTHQQHEFNNSQVK
jgi:hypothetical protein